MKIRIFYLVIVLNILPNNLLANAKYFKDGLNLFKNQKFIEAKFKFPSCMPFLDQFWKDFPSQDQ